MKKVGLLLISTGRYHHFIQPLIESADTWFLNDMEVTYFLFTDSKEKYNSNRNIVYLEQEHKPWPSSTLFRYKIFYNKMEILSNMEYLYYCDIDMLFVDVVGNEILSERVATIHPGFKGERGTPETRPESKACVLPNESMTYFAGGFNGGKTKAFLEMCKAIDLNIESDLTKGIIAVWHDESHLNRYMIDNPPTKILDPGYCYPEQVMIQYNKKLLALNKNHSELRK